MDPEGTSRDDLDVRLHWPGGDREGVEQTEEPTRLNGRGSGETQEAGTAFSGSDARLDALLMTVQSLRTDVREYSERLLRVEHSSTASLKKVEELSRQLEVLRRRTPLKARTEPDVTPEMVERIAESVARRLAETDLRVEQRPQSRQRSRRS